MIGITSYGGYIPRLRLDRNEHLSDHGLVCPGHRHGGPGRAIFLQLGRGCPHHGGVAASKDCLFGQDKSGVDGLFLCSTTLPFADRLNAGVVQTALNLTERVHAADVTSSLRAGTTGLVEALSAVKSGDRKGVLVTGDGQATDQNRLFL